MESKHTNIKEDHFKKEYEKFQEHVKTEGDGVMLVLRAHLFSETLLERLILAGLPRGDKVVEDGAYTYAQKLVLVEALQLVPDHISSSLRHLNKLRNQCAHRLSHKISESDAVRVGSPLGKFFTKARHDSLGDSVALLASVVAYVCGFLASSCGHAEDLDGISNSQTNELGKRA